MILRTYECTDCGYRLEVEVDSSEWDSFEAPSCAVCAQATAQSFKPFAITGSNHRRAVDIAQTIAHEDYGAADINRVYADAPPEVRYRRNEPTNLPAAGWDPGMLAGAIATGRADRIANGPNGMEILQAGLSSGKIPDLIEASKQRSAKVW